jgi:hypothetical protein
VQRFTLLAAFLTSFALSAPVVADAANPNGPGERTRTQDQDRVQMQEMDELRTHLQRRVRLSADDVTALEPELQRYFRLHGEQAHIRTMLQAGSDAGCVGTCMREMVRATNRAMVMGMQDNEAGAMVVQGLQESSRDRDRTGAAWSEAEFADQLRARVQSRLSVWEREHQRLLEGERELQQERDRQREQERSSDRTESPTGRGAGR